MHQLVLATKPHVNGSLKPQLTVHPEADDEMDTDQILQMLMTIQTDGARRDEKLTNIDKTVTGLADLQRVRITLEDTRHESVMTEIRGLQARVKSVEDAGISAWSVKKIIQWAAFIAAVGTVVGSIAGAIIWVAKHLKV